MVLEFAPHQYVDIDKVEALRWIEAQGKAVGIVALSGDKIVISERSEFDLIETAFIWKNKSYMFDENMAKIMYVKRGIDNVQ